MLKVRMLIKVTLSMSDYDCLCGNVVLDVRLMFTPERSYRSDKYHQMCLHLEPSYRSDKYHQMTIWFIFK